ncbi:MAG: mechanosensitive ion channel family protein [Desulfuromonadales bacterium]|nr:mechanosensitive ion channel family protein [Desulfuromonadales bacterium]NIS43215.1 mechanosensitive ion channel family protein [Desulfuromonadales bacterium]
MDIFREFIASISWDTVIRTGLRLLLILFAAWVALAIIRKLLKHLEARLIEKSRVEGEPPSEAAKRVETLFRLVRQAVRIVLWLTVGLIVLKEFGVEIGPILAGAGILGLAVGFGAQNLVRDVISGFFFILENQVRVGDVAIINGTGGLVESINFRTIVLRDLAGTVHVFPNGTVTTLSNMTNEWSAWVFDIGVAYKENTDKVTEVIREVAEQMRQDDTYGPLIIEDVEIFGVNKFGDSAVEIKGRLKTKPIRQWMVGREFLRRIKLAFDERDIEIPFPHRTVYFGEASPPFDLRLFDKAGGAASGGESGN